MDKTRKEAREELVNAIKNVADYSCDCGITNCIDLIRYYLKEGDTEKVEECLCSIEECCKLIYARNMQTYHAMEMMAHYALALGDKYDPMY